mmetsp:Transcript_25659/g.39013  ORF Transcript_25659/g.39013 Transcript_25659/m.39013 type:complete len:97 (-) Transcript_25659:335-625(-)
MLRGVELWQQEQWHEQGLVWFDLEAGVVRPSVFQRRQVHRSSSKAVVEAAVDPETAAPTEKTGRAATPETGGGDGSGGDRLVSDQLSFLESCAESS